jgi:hypothetical protein
MSYLDNAILVQAGEVWAICVIPYAFIVSGIFIKHWYTEVSQHRSKTRRSENIPRTQRTRKQVRQNKKRKTVKPEAVVPSPRVKRKHVKKVKVMRPDIIPPEVQCKGCGFREAEEDGYCQTCKEEVMNQI